MQVNVGAKRKLTPDPPPDASEGGGTPLVSESDSGRTGTPALSPILPGGPTPSREGATSGSSDGGASEGQTPPGKIKPTSRPPALTVDTTMFEAPEPVVPRTPANMRSLQRTEMHAMVCAGDLPGTTALLKAGHSVDAQEEHGFTPLHWAAACGHSDVVRQLLPAGARVGAKSTTGETALHRAARFGRLECVKELLRGGASPTAPLNRSFESALDVAGKAEKRLNRPARLAVRKLMLEAAPEAKVMLLHHAECSQHATGDNHQEHPLRIDAVLARALPPAASPAGSGGGGGHSRSHAPSSSELPRHELAETTDFAPASLEALRRVHDPSYLSSVASMSHAMAVNPPRSPVPFTPLVQRTHGVAFDLLKDPKACDTRISAGSFDAARRAAGAVLHAVDAVLAGRQRNALCVVRPPGHHAGYKGLIPGSCSCGFCLINSVMVGAAHALLAPPAPPTPPPAASSAAVAAASASAASASASAPPPKPPPPAAASGGTVDGSGTGGSCSGGSSSGSSGSNNGVHAPGAESALLACEPCAEPARRVAIIDFDVHHGDGSEEILRHLSTQLPPGALFFASIHLYDAGDANFGQFYPGSGAADVLALNAINVPLTPLWRRKASHEARAASHPKGGAAASSPRANAFGSGRLEWRAAFAQRIVPSLRAFCPDLILVSAGFDGGAGDIGNSKLDAQEKYHQGLDLNPTDFEWATEQLLSVAAVCCPGRVVSVLEGGYGVYEFSKSSETGWAISRTQLGENVAAHLAALAGVNPRPAVC